LLAVERHRSGAAARFPVRELVGTLLGGDDRAALALAERVLVETESRTSVFADLLHPAQLEISNLWYVGRVTYTDEVRAAAAVRRIVGVLSRTPSPRPEPRAPRCILAVPHGDPHDVGLQMFTLAIQDHGWAVEVVGPVQDLREMADLVVDRRPQLFGLSAGVLPPLREVEAMISAVSRVRVPVLLGGVAFNRRPHLWQRLGARGLGTDARVGVVLAQRIGLR
jgi:5-methyltetrahydrofolate--homocysteine methyltransferase